MAIKLTEAQKQFIYSEKKRIRVLAGPGAGKSFCMKRRILNVVKEKGVSPEKILVLTFTSIAAQDLRNDIKDLAKSNPGICLDKVKVSTLHALALEQLKKEKKIERWMFDFEKDTMLRDLEPKIGKIRGKKDLLKQCVGRSAEVTSTEEEACFKKSLDNWQEQHHGLVFDGLIPYVCQRLSKSADARERLSYDQVLVDEYQDLNADEQWYVELLTSKEGTLCVIGDDDQSIYGFKGANPSGIREFIEKHPGCDDIRFPECHRCPAIIVEYATNLIECSKDSGRIDKEFISFIDEHGVKNQNGICESNSSETPAKELDDLREIILQGCSDIEAFANKAKPKETGYGRIVVLSATKKRGKKLYDTLQKAGIPAAFCFRGAILGNKVVQENLSLLTLAAIPDDLISWRYLLGYGSSNRRALSYKRILDCVNDKRGLHQVLAQCASGEISIPYTYTIIERYKEISKSLSKIRTDPTVLFNSLGEKEKDYADILRRAIKEKFQSDGLYAVRQAVLDEVFSPEAAAASDRVRIMSLHAAKGLSAQMVIIMSATDNMIPMSGKDIEEQRRLFYVAITRCKGSIDQYPGKVVVSYFTHSEDGTVEHRMSRFFGEMNN